MSRAAQMIRWGMAALLAVLLVGCFPPPKGSGGGGTSSSVSSSIPWEPELVTTESTLDLTCRAKVIVVTTSATLSQAYRIEAPVEVPEGTSFDIVLRPSLILIGDTYGESNVPKIGDIRTAYRLPAGVVVHSVTEEPSPGSSLVGYYVAPGSDRSDPTTHEAIPGGSQVTFDPSTRSVRTSLPGTGNPATSDGEFRGDSAVQPPHVRISVTATASAGTDLVTEVGGTLPADPDVLPWADPSAVVNFLTPLLTYPANFRYFCAPFPGADIALSTTRVIGGTP